MEIVTKIAPFALALIMLGLGLGLTIRNFKRVITKETSKKIKNILRKVVTHEKGTASLANIYGYNVSGKTGTSQYYDNENKNINTTIQLVLKAGINFYFREQSSRTM